MLFDVVNHLGGIDRDATRDCHIVDFPCADKKVSENITSDKQAMAFLQLHIATHPFVRMCGMSPKDTGHVVFNTAEDAFNSLKQSSRCHLSDKGLHQHIVMKERRQYTAESRCFFNGEHFTLVSGTIEPTKVKKWLIETEQCEMPTDKCCFELGEYTDGIELIEFNCIDASPDPLEWDQSWYEILHGTTTIWATPFEVTDLKLDI